MPMPFAAGAGVARDVGGEEGAPADTARRATTAQEAIFMAADDSASAAPCSRSLSSVADRLRNRDGGRGGDAGPDGVRNARERREREHQDTGRRRGDGAAGVLVHRDDSAR